MRRAANRIPHLSPFAVFMIQATTSPAIDADPTKYLSHEYAVLCNERNSSFRSPSVAPRRYTLWLYYCDGSYEWCCSDGAHNSLRFS
jgi:hypothetical protein